jgi:hypothetical protein
MENNDDTQKAIVFNDSLINDLLGENQRENSGFIKEEYIQ